MMSYSGTRAFVLVCVCAIVVTGLLQVPYVLGYVAARAGTQYTGLLVNVEDANYLTIIQRGSEGAWLHSLRFTSEPDTPAFLYVFYLALGHLAGVLHVDAVTMWHAARIVLTLVTFLVAYGFIGYFIANPRRRMVAWLLAILGAGFDWFAFPWETLAASSATPVDLKMADAHLFSAALTFPHYLASITLLMVVFWCGVRLMTEKLDKRKTVLLVGGGALANVAIGLVYPFFVILACGVLVVFLGWLMVRARRILWRQAGLSALLIAPTVPLVLYYEQALANSELLRIWSAQSQTLSPSPLHYLLTYAPYLLLAIWGLPLEGLGPQAQAERRALLWVWVIVVAVLAYAPLGAQRRFLQGVQVPLAILATYGLFEAALPRLAQARWFQALAQRPNYSAVGLKRLVVVLLILLVSLSSVYQWVSAVALAAIVQPYPLFRPIGELQAMDWLKTQAKPDDVLLSAYYTGSYLPLRTGARVYLGHIYETIRFEDKQKAVAQFFDASTTDATRIKFLHENGIAYLFYGRSERALGGFDPTRAAFLRYQFGNAEAAVYQVATP